MHVELNLADHSDRNIDVVGDLSANIEYQLTSQKDPVCVLLECAGVERQMVDRFDVMTGVGIAPSLAFSLSIALDTDPASAIEAAQSKPYGQNERSYFLRAIGGVRGAELEILDRLCEEYRDKEGNSRLHVVLEDSNENLNFGDGESLIDALNMVFGRVKSGDFATGYSDYRNIIHRFSQDCRAREKRVAEKIGSLQQSGERVVVVAFGTAHTGIRTELEADHDIHPTLKFLDKSANCKTWWFGPNDSVLRKARFFGIEALSEEELYQGMLGLSCTTVLDYVVGELAGEVPALSEQDRSVISTQFARQFDTPEKIEAFRQSVIETNIVTALMNWGVEYLRVIPE